MRTSSILQPTSRVTPGGASQEPPHLSSSGENAKGPSSHGTRGRPHVVPPNFRTPSRDDTRSLWPITEPTGLYTGEHPVPEPAHRWSLPSFSRERSQSTPFIPCRLADGYFSWSTPVIIRCYDTRTIARNKVRSNSSRPSEEDSPGQTDQDDAFFCSPLLCFGQRPLTAYPASGYKVDSVRDLLFHQRGAHLPVSSPS